MYVKSDKAQLSLTVTIQCTERTQVNSLSDGPIESFPSTETLLATMKKALSKTEQNAGFYSHKINMTCGDTKNAIIPIMRNQNKPKPGQTLN